MKPIVKRRVFTPGPTPLLPEALLPALVSPMHHRKGDFKTLFREVQQGLGRVFKTRNEILLLGCSGSGAMEAAMTNLLAPGEKAVVAVAGKFGERWMELAEKFEVRAEVVKVPYGQSVTADQISSALSKDSEISAVFVQATETSTGARMDIERIGALVKRHDNTVLVVDAITGLGTSPLHTDEWGLDIVIGGSQKAFMVPPGVAMMSVSPKAWKQIEKCARPRYYFDLVRERAGQREGQSAFTPSISIIQGLKASLDLILKEGVDSLVFNASLQAGATRAAIKSWGMKVFPECPSDATTAFVPPPELSAAKVQSLMEEKFGILISGGQGTLKGKLLRIGHLGYFDFLETLGMIACLELSLVEAGAAIELGTGTRAAAEYYRQATGASRP